MSGTEGKVHRDYINGYLAVAKTGDRENIMTDMNNQELIEAVKAAMGAELKAADFYKNAADNTSDPAGKNMFLELTRFEQSHHDALSGLLESIQAGGSLSEYAGISFAVPKAEAPTGSIPKDELTTQIDALTTAIAAEKKAKETYAQLAAKSDDPLLVALFSKLSDEENLHRKVLEDQFYALSNQGHWVWGE